MLHTVTYRYFTVTYRYFTVPYRYLTVTYRYFTVTSRYSPFIQRHPPLLIISHRFLFYIVYSPFPTVSYNYFFYLNFLAERNQKNIKNTKQSNKKKNKNTVSVFGFSHGYYRDPQAIKMRRYWIVTLSSHD